MFGIFHALTTLIAGGISDAKIASQDAQYRQNSADLVYTDSRGQRRLRSNNQVVYDYYSQDGDYIIRGRYFTLTPTRDRINAQVAEAKERGDDTPILYYDYKHNSDYYRHEVPGYRYINPMTEDIYAIYPYKSLMFYINVFTYELVRPTFDQLEFERECKRRGLHYFTWQEMQEMIHHFNGATLAARKRYFTNKDGFACPTGYGEDYQNHLESSSHLMDVLFKSRIDKKGHYNYTPQRKRDTERIDECRA